jgi:small Trp-rich protein
MPFVLIGALLIALKLAELGPFDACPWGLAIAPLVLAVLWWRYQDASGLTKRREMARLEQRKDQRRRDALTRLGVGPDGEKAQAEADKARATRQREIDRIEGHRAKARARARDSILGSRLDSELPSNRNS